jgi:hypothetical protein
MLTLFGLKFNLCHSLGALTATESSSKQDDGKSFMPQESSGTDRYHRESHERLLRGPCMYQKAATLDGLEVN